MKIISLKIIKYTKLLFLNFLYCSKLERYSNKMSFKQKQDYLNILRKLKVDPLTSQEFYQKIWVSVWVN